MHNSAEERAETIATLGWHREFPQVVTRSRGVAWFRHLSPLMQSILVVVAVSTVTLTLVVGGFLAFLAWDDHQFQNGSYCNAEPQDPLC